MDVEDENFEMLDLSSPVVVEKYREAASVVQAALSGVVAYLQAGKSIAEVCEYGDNLIVTGLSKAYKNKGYDKGISFPTCISVNDCVGHFSPLFGETKALADGDLVKVDMGAHIDGFAVMAAHSVVIGASAAAPVTGARADLMAAAHVAAEVALRTIKPGNTNYQVTNAIQAVTEHFGVKAMQGVLMHDMRQYVIDGAKVVMLRSDDAESRVEEVKFEPNEVYTVDIVLSTGEGKPRELDTRTTVYKRSPESNYGVKMKASKALLNEIGRKFQYMPFTLRSCLPGEEATARMGITECLRHGIVQPFPVLYEKDGAQVAHVKFTVLMLNGGSLKIGGLAVPDYLRSEKAASLPADMAALLATEPYQSKKAKKAAKAAADMDMS